MSNLTLACIPCNQKKGNHPIEEFLKQKPEVLKKIQAQAKVPLKDAAAVNSTRWALFERLHATGLPVEVGSGGLTKFNRSQRDLENLIKAMGHGSRQMCRMDRFGFPRTSAKANKVVQGFQTGDMVRRAGKSLFPYPKPFLSKSSLSSDLFFTSPAS